MKNQQIFIDKISLRLKAPIISLEKMAAGKHLPRVFVEAALSELYSIQELLEKEREVLICLVYLRRPQK